jgi:hypothetical protein
MIPIIAHASQVGIRPLSHLTAPTATNAIPIKAITMPPRIKATDRTKRLTKCSAGFTTPLMASRRINFTSFSARVGFSDSDNASA